MQVAALALFCLPVLAAGWGLFGAFSGTETEVATPAQGPFYGSLASSSVAGVTLLDPLAVLEMAAAVKSFDPLWLVGALPVVLVDCGLTAAGRQRTELLTGGAGAVLVTPQQLTDIYTKKENAQGR